MAAPSPFLIVVLCFWWIGLGWGAPGMAQGNENLMSRPTEYTDVADGFDGDSTVDVRLSLGFSSVQQGGTIVREVGESHGLLHTERFAKAELLRKHLWMMAEVGLYHDLMVFVRVPFLLEDKRALSPTDLARNSGLVQPGEAADGPGEQDWRSQVRDGLPTIQLGIAWGLLNQFRGPGLPTVVLRAAMDVATGPAMRPCLNGQGCFRGAGRGTVGLLGEARLSYRYRYAEPYGGFSVGREFVTNGEGNFGLGADLSGGSEVQPPQTAGFTLGVALIPWEARHRFQRLTLDTRFSATYISRGRDYTPLYDALGTTAHPDLADGGNHWFAGADVQSGGFSGMTTAASHARLSGEFTIRIQAARYVNFHLGIGAFMETAHLLTGSRACLSGHLEESEGGASCIGGRPNPAFRPLIDRPGGRFRIGDAFGLMANVGAGAVF